MCKILEEIAANNPQKLEELTAFHWFTRAQDIKSTKLYFSERPDFLMEMEGNAIGVEITMAERNLPGSPFSAKQIEQAHRAYAEALLERVRPKIPLEIGLIFNDEVPVDKSSVAESIDAVVSEIDRISNQMAYHSVERLVRNVGDIRTSSGQPLHVCKEVPDFLQHIQLFNDGQEFTCVAGSRGGILYDFTDADLEPILQRKHKALKGYAKCDEQWLVIVAGTLPPIYRPDEPPKIFIPSTSQAFSGVSVSTPIVSDFDRVVFFQSPTTVHQLT